MATHGSNGHPKERDEDRPLSIAVKFRAIGDKPPSALRGVEGLLDRTRHGAEPLKIKPLFESSSRSRLDELVERARRNDPTYEPTDFNFWTQVTCPEDVEAEGLAMAIRQLKEVETAYVIRPLPPPLVNAMDDPRSTNQGYLDAAPNGIDARHAWAFAGGDGAGVGFVDLEQGWNLNHEDLIAAGVTLISGTNTAYYSHGTSVLGEVLMVDNMLGGVGIAPAATGRVISQHRPSGYNTADAIVDAVANMAFGDVLLLEAQETDPVGGQYYWPVEIADANYDAIRLGSALGIVIVEAGCNGGYDLDAYTNLGGDRIFDRTSADFRDSGAIMVGAASSASPHVRLGFSNFGTRVDCYAWGENIDTTATNGAGTANTLYTTGFNGTSGASPIVVGAALIVQGMAEASLGYRFSPRELREILRMDGTPSAAPATDLIGVMPNLNAIITNGHLNLAPDSYLRDYVGDTGDPTSGMVSSSPDIIVRHAPVADPQASFGEGSGTENDANLSQVVETGHDHTLYVRLQNRGGSVASPVDVDLYWSPPATLVTPNLWSFIGSVSLPSLATGNVLTASGAVTWPQAAIPGPGHYCFVAVTGSPLDPKPDPAAFGSFDNFVTYVENNNNVAWRNFNVVAGPPSSDGPPGFHALPFLTPGAFDTSRRFALETIGRLPKGARAILEAPEWLAEALRPHPVRVQHDEKRRVARIPLNPHGVQPIGQAILHAKSMAECRLLVSIPEEARGHGYEIAVRQLYKNREVGRVTWRFPGRSEGYDGKDRGKG